LDAGGVKATLACALPAVAVPMVGAPGTVAGVTLLEAADTSPAPAMLCAATVQVTGVPLGSGVTTIGDAGPLTLTAPQVAR